MLSDEQIVIGTAAEFEQWLAANGKIAANIWVIIYKKASGRQTVTGEELRDSGLCYGWVDVVVKAVDDERFALQFKPRKPNSTWGPNNRRRAHRLLAASRVTPTGMATLPPDLLFVPLC